MNNKHNKTKDEQVQYARQKLTRDVEETKRQDVFLKLMADYIYHQLFSRNFDVSLNELYRTRAERHAIAALAHQQKMREAGNVTSNIYNDSYIWGAALPMSLFSGRIMEVQVKLKDAGKFRALEKDNRIQHLLDYDDRIYAAHRPSDWKDKYVTIPTNIISRQIDDYEKFVLTNC